MRPRLMAVAAFILVALAGAAVVLTLTTGRAPDQVARVIGPRPPIPAPPTPPATPPPTATTSADPALDLEGITHWHNSAPLTLKALRGKLLLVDLHHVVTGPALADGTLSLAVPGTPVRLYTRTFGG